MDQPWEPCRPSGVYGVPCCPPPPPRISLSLALLGLLKKAGPGCSPWPRASAARSENLAFFFAAGGAFLRFRVTGSAAKKFLRPVSCSHWVCDSRRLEGIEKAERNVLALDWRQVPSDRQCSLCVCLCLERPKLG